MATKPTNIGDDEQCVRAPSLADEMAAFDRLPPAVRRKLAEADKEHSAWQVEQMIKEREK